MYPSKVIFEQSKTIDLNSTGDLVERCFNEVYSPKHTLEELVAELESNIQSKINANPKEYLAGESLYGIQPQHVMLKIEDLEDQNLPQVVQSKGKCLNFNAKVEYEEIQLVGYLDNNYMIANAETDLWNDYAEVIYIPDEPGLTIRKIKFLE
jgi:hypothetical protein